VGSREAEERLTVLADNAVAVENHEQIMLALIALVGTAIATLAWVIRNGRVVRTGADDAAVAAKQATATNAAVNNVGDSSKHKLYDMVERIDERSAETVVKVAELGSDMKVVKADVADLKQDQDQFDSHGWETLPPDISTAVGLTTTVRDLQNNHKAVNEKLDTLISELREHVVWEMDTKYGKHDPT